MRFPRSFVPLLVLAILMIVSAACTGAKPAVMADIPVYAGATPVDASADVITDAMVKAIQRSIAEQNLSSEITLYRLPDGTQWDAVKQFYTDQIVDDWKAAPEVTQEGGAINLIGWQRGSGASEQMLITAQTENPTSGTTFLLVGLFSE